MFRKSKPQLDTANLPRHIGIVMDGNRRWAAKRGLPAAMGHQAGVNALREITSECAGLGIESLTVYTFSTENNNRAEDEKKELMRLFNHYFDNIEKEIGGKNIVLRIIGEKDGSGISREMLSKFENAENFTKNNTGMNFNIAMFYGGQAEIVTVVNGLIDRGEKVTVDSVNANLYTRGQPPLDFIIRCGKEKRLSNFMLWQSSYAELYFCDTLWPDFKRSDLHAAIMDYQRRNRRFGKN